MNWTKLVLQWLLAFLSAVEAVFLSNPNNMFLFLNPSGSTEIPPEDTLYRVLGNFAVVVLCYALLFLLLPPVRRDTGEVKNRRGTLSVLFFAHLATVGRSVRPYATDFRHYMPVWFMAASFLGLGLAAICFVMSHRGRPVISNRSRAPKRNNPKLTVQRVAAAVSFGVGLLFFVMTAVGQDIFGNEFGESIRSLYLAIMIVSLSFFAPTYRNATDSYRSFTLNSMLLSGLLMSQIVLFFLSLFRKSGDPILTLYVVLFVLPFAAIIVAVFLPTETLPKYAGVPMNLVKYELNRGVAFLSLTASIPAAFALAAFCGLTEGGTLPDAYLAYFVLTAVNLLAGAALSLPIFSRSTGVPFRFYPFASGVSAAINLALVGLLCRPDLQFGLLSSNPGIDPVMFFVRFAHAVAAFFAVAAIFYPKPIPANDDDGEAEEAYGGEDLRAEHGERYGITSDYRPGGRT